MRTSDMYIGGVGVFLPDPVSIETAVEGSRFSAEEVAVHGWTGVAVAGDIPAPEMALRAAQEACKRAGQRPEEIDLLLYADTWHQGPDGWQPQYYLQRYLVGGDALAVEVRHGCNGMFSALELATSYLRADQDRTVALIVVTDNFGTPLMVDRCPAGAGLIIGDAACAFTLTKEPSFAQLLSVNSATVPEAEEIHRCGEPLFPPGATIGRALDYAERIEKYQRREQAEPTSTPGFMKVQQKLMDCVNLALSEAGIESADITRVALMNTAKEQAEERFMKMFGLPLERSTWEFGSTVGHIGASDQIASFEHLLANDELAPGDHLLMFGLGPGITLSCAVIKVLATPPWRG